MNTTTRENTNTKARVGLVSAAVVGSTLVWLAAELLGLDATVRMDGTVQIISGVTVAVSAAVASLSAWAVKAILDRLLRNPTPAWMTISISFGLLSLAGPVTMATTPAAGTILVVMHVVAAAFLIPGLASTRPRIVRTEQASQAGVDAASAGSGYGGTP